MEGHVTLVGAGPGDPDLLTIAGKEALECCDVVVHDRLVSATLLQRIPPHITKINVGKQAGHHPTPQKEINYLLLHLAQEGKNVVRLKGGDSFIFGRGGEELELLKEHKIPFTVIPGISSSLSGSTYAGIPLTHRDFSSSLHIITGHKKENSTLSLPYKSLVDLNGTLVFMMSVSSISDIMTGLQEHGLSPSTPVAVIENATLPRQRKVISTVNCVVDVVSAQHIQSPALIIVGSVCQLDFDFFTTKPLFGKNILVCSPRESEGRLAQALTHQGACVSVAISLNTQQISPVFPSLLHYNTIIFTSSRGVDSFFQALFANNLDIRSCSHLTFAVVGSSTNNTLKKYHIHADFIPSSSNGATLATELLDDSPCIAPFLVVTGENNSGEVQRVLQSKNQEFETLCTYNIDYAKEELPTDIDYHAVAFTCGNMVHHFSEHYPNLSHLPAFCIGETTNSKAIQQGFSTIVSKNTSIDGMVDRIKEYFHDK